MSENVSPRDRALLAVGFLRGYFSRVSDIGLRKELLDRLDDIQNYILIGSSSSAESDALLGLLSKNPLTSSTDADFPFALSDYERYYEWTRFGSVLGKPTYTLIDALGITPDDFEDFLHSLPADLRNRFSRRVPLFSLLLYLYLLRNGPKTPRDLVNELGRYPSYYLAPLRYLESLGLVSKREDGSYAAKEVVE